MSSSLQPVLRLEKAIGKTSTRRKGGRQGIEGVLNGEMVLYHQRGGMEVLVMLEWVIDDSKGLLFF